MPDQLNDKGFLLRNLMENMPDFIYFKDLQGRFIRVSKLLCERVGAPEEQVIHKTDFDFFPKQHAEEAYANEQEVMATGTSLIGLEEKVVWKNGTVMWVSSTKMPLKDAGGKTIGLFGISRDITENKKAELKAVRYADEMRQIKEGMEEDVRIAAELQKTFFPREYPVFPSSSSEENSRVRFHHHYHPSSAVSGDFCTIHKLSETECGVLLCDVMGHGVRASLGTALICAMAEELVFQESDPGDFLSRMNELLLPIFQQDDTFLFATACYIAYDTATGRVRMANAGHPAPLLLHGKTNSAEWLMKDDSFRGPALAISDEAEFLTLEQKIDPGDAVVMYTDGIYEVVNSQGEELGEQRLLDTVQRHVSLPLAELFSALIDDARCFSEAGEFDDDICLVGFRCKALDGGMK